MVTEAEVAQLAESRNARVSQSAPGPKPKSCYPDLIPPLDLSRPRSISNPESMPQRALIEVSTELLPLSGDERFYWLPHLSAGLGELRSAADGYDRRFEFVFERSLLNHRTRTVVSVDLCRMVRLLFWIGVLSSLSTCTALSLSTARRPFPTASRSGASRGSVAVVPLVEPLQPPPLFTPPLRVSEPRAAPLGVDINVQGRQQWHQASGRSHYPAAATARTHPALAEARQRLQHATRYLRHHSTDIEEAVDFAVMAHDGQWRKSGEPFVVHPIEVACILAELKMDSDTIVAGLLHDVVEDTLYSADDLCSRFGTAVARIVSGVTDGDARPAIDNQRDLLLAMSAEWRVVLVKLADRLHNMRTLGAMPRAKRERKARETMQLFVPLAARVGVKPLEAELRRLSTGHLHPFASAPPPALQLLEALPGSEALLDWLTQRQCPATLDALLHGDAELSARGVGWEIASHRRRWEAHCARSVHWDA